jgi:protease IV
LGTLLRVSGRAWRDLRFSLVRARLRLGNWLRRRRRRRVDYVVIPVEGPLPERSGPPRGFVQRRLPFPAEPLSLQELNRRLGLIADAENVKGIVLLFQGLEAGMATLQNLRTSLLRLRATGKQVVVYTPYLDLAHYWAASAADRICAPPSATFEFLGLRVRATYLRDALARLGIEAQVFRVSAFKSAYSLLDQSEMTAEEREQLNWILDDLYGTLIGSISQAREMEPEVLRSLIDGGPYDAKTARALGLIDDVAYEDELASLLGPGVAVEAKDESDRPDAGTGRSETASLLTWNEGSRMLLRKARRQVRGYVGVVSLNGLIVMGTSRRTPLNLPLPFIGSSVTGDLTVAQQLRAAERDRRLMALIVHIDSRGGVALASDLIWRELVKFGRKKPLLAYMGNTAASGGYYVAAPAAKIMAQPLTMTGSIGVTMAHVVLAQLYEKLAISRVELARGERAGLHSPLRPLSQEESRLLTRQMEATYHKFKQIVADGRSLPYEDMDPLCGGRVWTGNQARDKGLVDEHGDFVDAVRLVGSMAGLPVDDEHVIRTVNLFPRSGPYLLGKPADGATTLLPEVGQRMLRQLLNQPLALAPVEAIVD